MPNKGDGQMRPEQHEWQNLASDIQGMIDNFLRYEFDANYIARQSKASLACVQFRKDEKE